MSTTLGWIRQFHTPESPSAPPLVICPHAGTGASAYRAFSEHFSRYFDVVALQYPGRQDRVGEPAAASVEELAEEALAEFAESPHNRGQGVTVFGHSMGGIVAFEFVRAAESAGIPVRLLAVSAVVPPGRQDEQAPHPDDEDDILDRLVELGGTGAEILGSRDIMRMAIPALKADYRIIDTYSCADDETVDAPVSALGGDDDPIVTVGDLYGWEAHTTAGVSVSLFGGGHFYLNDNMESIAELLASPDGVDVPVISR
ncbi:thioesterase II family protein [Rhodococcoides kyotonense]|uniref:Thioesterase TesA n=1 Tax=Rhodococcoides kyotonense TaxID=398843 RepID=A0A239N2R2_9NOCA|nr:alpha/beta fold hydrolase [Rhodococcus kyotonensis]SNT49246.1 Surfactin synthase thioesterase subunit [Rhodococcus kyotonensis]